MKTDFENDDNRHLHLSIISVFYFVMRKNPEQRDKKMTSFLANDKEV